MYLTNEKMRSMWPEAALLFLSGYLLSRGQLLKVRICSLLTVTLTSGHWQDPDEESKSACTKKLTYRKRKVPVKVSNKCHSNVTQNFNPLSANGPLLGHHMVPLSASGPLLGHCINAIKKMHFTAKLCSYKYTCWKTRIILAEKGQKKEKCGTVMTYEVYIPDVIHAHTITS